MKPSPPVTTHRRPANGVDRHGVQSAVSVGAPAVSPLRPGRRDGHGRRDPHLAVDREPHRELRRRRRRDRTTLASSTASPRSMVPRYSIRARTGDPTREARDELVLDRLERPRVVHVVEHVEVARRATATVATPRVGRRRAVHAGGRAPAGRRPTRRSGRGSRRRAASGRPCSRSTNTHSAGRLDQRAAVAGQLRAPLGPARPDAAAERRQLDRLRGTRACATISRSLERSTHTPRALGEPGVVGVVGGDVLEVPGQRLEPQPAGGVDVAEVHPPGRPEHPPAGGQRPRTRPARRHRRTARRRGCVSSGHRGCAETLRIGDSMATDEGANGVGIPRPPGAARGAPPLVVHRRVGRGRGRRSSCSRAALDGQFSDNFRIPDAQSQQALDLLEQDFPEPAGDSALVVFERPTASRARRSSPRSARASPRSGRSRTSRR